jgi:preprotein translocase subunit YajC
MTNLLNLIAQATTQPAGGTPQPRDSFMRFMFPLLLAFGVFYFLIFRGQRKDKKHHAEMLANLKRNDRVQTIGGVLGTVVEAREHEVILKVDESSNTKMRFNRAAIKEVLSAESDAS